LASETELVGFLDDFTYSGNGAFVGSVQTYTLSRLAIGQTYDLGLYIRAWDTEGSGRNIDLTFTNGDEVMVPFGALAEDRPGIILETGNDLDAYYSNYQYTAQATELQIEAGIHPGALGASGSFHLNGLTNEVATFSGDPVITNTLILGSGDFAMGFHASPSTNYQLPSDEVACLLGICFWREGFEGAFGPERRGAKGVLFP
jgi:hypothetical protein